MTTDEYLEKLALESFKREIDRDESIWRSLPLFIAALALIGTMLGGAMPRLPELEGGWPRAAVWIGFGCTALLLLIAGERLWRTIRPRSYAYPPNDVELRDYADKLEAFHAGEGLGGEELDGAVVQELRALVVERFGAAATGNRSNNERRLMARSQALSYGYLGFLLALALVAAIFFVEAGARSEEPVVAAGSSEEAGAPGAPTSASCGPGVPPALDEPTRVRGERAQDYRARAGRGDGQVGVER